MSTLPDLISVITLAGRHYYFYNSIEEETEAGMRHIARRARIDYQEGLPVEGKYSVLNHSKYTVS